MKDPEDTSSPEGNVPEVLSSEVDELILQAGVADDADAIDALAAEVLVDLGETDQGVEFGLMLVDELRRRAEVLRTRPQ